MDLSSKKIIDIITPAKDFGEEELRKLKDKNLFSNPSILKEKKQFVIDKLKKFDEDNFSRPLSGFDIEWVKNTRRKEILFSLVYLD